MNNRIDDKGKIEYPCKWLYKIIGTDRTKIEAALILVLGEQEINIQFSNMSKKGSYLAFNMEIEVDSERQRDKIYEDLKKHPDIKAVL